MVQTSCSVAVTLCCDPLVCLFLSLGRILVPSNWSWSRSCVLLCCHLLEWLMICILVLSSPRTWFWAVFIWTLELLCNNQYFSFCNKCNHWLDQEELVACVIDILYTSTNVICIHNSNKPSDNSDILINNLLNLDIPVGFRVQFRPLVVGTRRFVSEFVGFFWSCWLIDQLILIWFVKETSQQLNSLFK